MSPNGKLWTAAITAGVIGALIGAGAVWAIDQQTPDTSTADAAQLVAIKAELNRRDEQIEALAEKYNSLLTSVSVEPTATSTSTTPPPAAETKKQFTFVKAATAGSKPTVNADFAEWLTGSAANAAAKAHGDESPPPNDYYIVNDNKQLRTLPVKTGIMVKLTARDDGTSEPEGYTVPFAAWASYYASPADDNRGIIDGPYWFTITDGVVTAIEEQYTP